MNMPKLERLHEFAESLLNEKEAYFSVLKQSLIDRLDRLEDRSSGDIPTLWTQLKCINDELGAKENEPAKSKASPRRRRGRKRKKKREGNAPSATSSGIMSVHSEPPRKRRKSSGPKSAGNTDGNTTHKFTFSRKGSRKHRRLSMTTDHGSGSKSDAVDALPIADGHGDDGEERLRSMLVAAERALELTDLNMYSLQHCIDTVDEFKDSLDGDSMALADEMRES